MKKIYFLAIALAFTVTLNAQVSEEEFQALKALYNATGGNNWKKRTGWENINSTATKNDVTTSWYGIENITDGHILQLSLNTNNLIGIIPVEIGNLKWLVELKLYDNNLYGTIPKEIGRLVSLEYLNLASNKIKGPLPDSLSNLVNMKAIYLSSNPLNCQFDDDIFFKMNQLSQLILYSCQLTGTLGKIFDYVTDLRGFDVSKNQFTGEIPASFDSLPNLTEVHFNENKFTGKLPSLKNSTSTIYYLTFSDNQFTGTIPETYGKTTKLKYLHINDNKLSGVIPAGLFTNMLQRLWINNNYFTFTGIEPVWTDLNNLWQKEFNTSYLFPIKEKSVQLNAGQTLTLNATTLSQYELGGNNNRYKWFRNNTEVYSGNNPAYAVTNTTAANSGVYRFEVTNTVAAGLVLKSENITVSVLVQGNTAPTNILLSQSEINENKTGNLAILSATDADSGDSHRFFLSAGNGVNDRDNALFAIDGNVLKLNHQVNFEIKPELKILLSADDMKGGICNKEITIKVIDVNEPPVFDQQLIFNTIDETVPNNSTVFTLVAPDPEKNPVTFSIAAGNETGVFGLAGNKLVVADNSKLDYDTKSQYTLTVEASDGTLNSTATFNISLSKINKMPQISNAVFSINENAASGTKVGTFTASDPEGAPLTFSIITGNNSGMFSLNGKDILIASSPGPDYEVASSYTLTINATDGISNVQAEITINVNNLPDETGRDLLSISVPGMVGQPVFNAVTGSVTVIISGTDITALPAAFSISKGATADVPNNSTLNFFTPKVIKVTAETGLIKNWTITVSYVTALGADKLAKISVYPNPVTNYLKVSGLMTGCSLFITDISGKMQLMRTNTELVQDINVADLKPGIYILKVQHAGIIDAFKFVKK